MTLRCDLHGRAYFDTVEDFERLLDGGVGSSSGSCTHTDEALSAKNVQAYLGTILSLLLKLLDIGAPLTDEARDT